MQPALLSKAKSGALLPLLIFLFTFFLNFSLISKGPYNLDCLELVIKAEATLATHQLQPQFGPGYPLTVLMAAFFVFAARLFSIQDPVLAVNFMSVVFGALCVLSYYFLAEKLFNKSTAVLSAIMLALCPIFLGVSVYGKNHTLSLFFLIQGVSWLISYLKTDQKKYFWGAALFLGCMGSAREPDLILMIVPISVLFLYGFSDNTNSLSRRFPKLIVFWLIALSVILLFHLPILGKSPEAVSGNQFFNLWRTGFQEDFLGMISPTLPKTLKYLVRTLTLFGLILSGLGLLSLSFARPRISIFLLLWTMVPLLFYGNKETLTPRYLSLILPALILAQGYLLGQLTKKNIFLKLAASTAFISIVCVLFARIYPILEFRHTHTLLPEFAKWIGRNTEANAKLIVGDEALFMHYYARRETISRPRSFRLLSDKDLEDFRTSLDNLLNDGVPVYITGIGLYAYDYNDQFSDFMKKNYSLEFTGQKMTEDWHRGEIYLQVGFDEVYQINKMNRD